MENYRIEYSDCDENQNHARADCCGDVLVLSVEKPVMQEFIERMREI